MKSAGISGAGSSASTTAHYLAEAGHEVTVVDRQTGAGAGNQLRQCRRGVARLFLALGRARHSAEGDQMAADAPRAAGGAADARSGDVVVAAQDAAQLHLGALRASTRRAWCRSPNTAATACASCAQRPASPMTSAARARCSCSAPQKQLDGIGGDIEVLKQFGVPFEVLDPAGCIAAEPALARGARQVRRRPAGCPATRPATARCSPTRLAAHARRARRHASASDVTIERHRGATAAGSARRADQRRAC